MRCHPESKSKACPKYARAAGGWGLGTKRVINEIQRDVISDLPFCPFPIPFQCSVYLRTLERSPKSGPAKPDQLASYPGRVGGEKRPGIDCLRMRDHSQKNLGIRLRLEIVGKINTYTSDTFPYHGKIQPFASRITFNSMSVEDNRRVYEAKDAFLRLPTSFGKSVRYEVPSFACLTVSKASWVQGGVATPLSC